MNIFFIVDQTVKDEIMFDNKKLRLTVWLLAFLVIVLVLISCPDPKSDNNHTPTLTDIKIAANDSQALTGPYLTTLYDAGIEYVVLFFGSDEDLDISKVVIDYFKDDTLVTTQKLHAVFQQVVPGVFKGYLNPTAIGTWKVEAYLEDAKGNKSEKKSITVTVTDAPLSTSTINITNSSASSFLATIYYGDQQENVTLDKGSSTFTFESTYTTPCMISYEGRYAESAHTNTFNVPYDGTYSVTLKANIGWIRLKNSTSEEIRSPKYGNTYFKWDANGNLLSEGVYSLLPDEEQYCRVESSGSDYIRFQLLGALKTIRLYYKTYPTLGTTCYEMITDYTRVVEE